MLKPILQVTLRGKGAKLTQEDGKRIIEALAIEGFGQFVVIWPDGTQLHLGRN